MSDAIDDQVGEVSAEEAWELFQRYHRAATGQDRSQPLMSIPADPKRDADLRLSKFIRDAGKMRDRIAKLEADRDRLDVLHRTALQQVEIERAKVADLETELVRYREAMADLRAQIREVLNLAAEQKEPAENGSTAETAGTDRCQ